MSYVFSINGVVQDWAAKKVSLRTLDVAFNRPERLVFVQHVAHTDADFALEDIVALAVDGTTRFRGRIRRVEHAGTPGTESVAYTALGPRELARSITVREADSGVPRVVFNAPPDDEDYDPARAAMSVGEIVEFLFDAHAAELRALDLIPPEPATGLDADELDSLAVVSPKVVFNSTNLDAALGSLLRFQRGHRLLVDPETRLWHFRKLGDLTEKTLTYNSPDRPLSALLKPTTRARATALEIVGPSRPVPATFTLGDASLEPLWDTDLEADWTWAKCFDPANDDSYAHVFRRFQVADESKRRLARALPEPAGLGSHPASRVPQVWRKAADGGWAPLAASIDFASGVVTLAQPATTGDEYASGGAACAEDIALVAAYLDEPLTARWPESGYEGTAYTTPANPIAVTRTLYDESFVRADQQAGRVALARELLAATKDIVHAGTVRLARLDWSLAPLDRRINLAASDDNGFPVETGFEHIAATLLGITFHFAESKTELHLSTDPLDTARGDSGLASLLRELAAQTRRTEQHRALDAETALGAVRLGNDGQTGAAAGSRGVYSVRRSGDDETGRVAGHIDLEAGPGVSIVRQVEAGHNGFRLSASHGQWLWFHIVVNGEQAGQTIDLHARALEGYEFVDWYPVLAGRLTKVIAYTPGTLTAGTITIAASRKTKTGNAACPESRTDHDAPAAVLSTATNIAHGIAEGYGSGGAAGIEFADDDVLGLRAALSADFAVPNYSVPVLAGALFEEDE